MAHFQALGTGPVSFVDANQNQREIPLSSIYFDGSQAMADEWPPYGTYKAIVVPLLSLLVSQGFLTAGTQTTAPAALSITANQAGAPGNEITVTFSQVTPTPAPGTFTVAVNATEIFPGLTPATIGNALGTSVATATGLVYLSANNNVLPVEFNGQIGGAAPYDCVVPCEAGGAAPNAFTLSSTSGAAYSGDGANINIALAPDPAPAQTFTLTVTWSKTAPNVTLQALETAATNPFGMLMTFSGPANGPLPAEGTLTLAGGAPAASTPAVAASVSAPST